MHEEEFIVIYEKIIKRRGQRDQLYLRKSKMDAMRNFSEDWKEWIFQETKDLLIIIDRLKRLGNPGLTQAVNEIETRIRDIQSDYSRKIISPMKRYSKGKKACKNEEEHFRFFRNIVENAENIVLELQSIRSNLSDMALVFLGSKYRDIENVSYIS